MKCWWMLKAPTSSAMSSPMSTLYTHCTIITINSSRDVILDGALLVRGSRIAAVDKTEVLFRDISATTTVVNLDGKIIIPGLVNTHSHLAQSLLRGLAENLPLHSWLCDAIWPLEASYAADDGYVAAQLTIAEMLKSGTTCFLESMLTFRSGFENVVRAVGESGIRACLGKLVKVQETNAKLGISDPRDKDIESMSIESALTAHEHHNGSFEDRLHVWMAAGTPRGSPSSAHRAIGDVCRKHDIGITMHCAEAPKDLEIFRNSYHCTPVEFCRDTNLTGKKTVLAHMVHLDLNIDLPILSETGTTIAHNPTSNCKLASGIARVPEMVTGCVNVSLGTDGAPCSNTYDMFREMHLAGIIHKGANRDASLIGATEVLEMATINGALALGLEREVGSLEVGKKADLVVIDPSGLHAAPFDAAQVLAGGIDPATVVVYSCTGSDVDTVMVDGKVLVKGGRLLTMDEEDIKKRAREVIGRIRTSSNIRAKGLGTWNYV